MTWFIFYVLQQNALLVLLGGNDPSGINAESDQPNVKPPVSVPASTDNQDLLDLLGGMF